MKTLFSPKDGFLGKITKSIKKDDTYAQKLDSLINTTEGRELFKNIREAWARYGAARNTTIRMVMEGKSAAAGTYLLKKVLPLQNDFFTALTNMAEFQRNLMERDSKPANVKSVRL